MGPRLRIGFDGGVDRGRDLSLARRKECVEEAGRCPPQIDGHHAGVVEQRLDGPPCEETNTPAPQQAYLGLDEFRIELFPGRGGDGRRRSGGDSSRLARRRSDCLLSAAAPAYEQCDHDHHRSQSSDILLHTGFDVRRARTGPRLTSALACTGNLSPLAG